MRRRAFLAGAGSLFAMQARASATIDGATAIAGDRFRAGRDEFHLADIIAPSAYDLHRDAQPHFHEAKAALHSLLSGKRVDVTEVNTPNRWGARIVTARIVDDSKTLQELLVERGAARVDPKTDDHKFIDLLFAIEEAARRIKTGLWGLTAYRIFDAGDATGAIGGYHLVEGRVVSARAARGRFYLNFGADYRDDFTATAPSRRARRWALAGLDLESLEDARLRVRGFVQSINGPSIELGHIKVIERLG